MENDKKFKDLATLFIIGLLFLGNFYFIVKDLWQDNIGKKVIIEEEFTSPNRKILSFLRLFIDKVLKADGEVSFEDRLSLENAVRGIDDQQILSQWQKFVDSKSDKEAQVNLRDLIDLLVRKIEE